MLKNAEAFEMGEGQDACLLIHGFTASPSQMRPLGEYLAARGLFVRAIVLPGHGTVITDMDKVSWRDWLTAARDAAKDLRKEGYRKVYAAGVSMGGVLSLILGEEALVDAVVSLAAPMRTYQDAAARFAWLVWPLYRYNKWKAPSDPETFLADLDAGYDASPVRRVPDLRKLMAIAEKGLPSLHCPLLVIQSHKDGTVRPVSADIIFSGAASKVKRLIMLKNSPHVVTLGPEREQVYEETAKFLGLS